MKYSHENTPLNRMAKAVFFLLVTTLFAAAQTQAQISDTKHPSSGPQPEWSSNWTGPFTCAAINASTAADVAHITTDNELRLNYTPPSTSDNFTYTAAAGSKPRVLVGTPDTGSTVTTDNSSSLNSLDWTSTKAIGAVLVGGASGNRLYWMPEGAALGTQFSGTGFQNTNGSTITKVAFCYHEPATVTIIKEVQNPSGQASYASQAFPFSTTNLGGSTFSLTDNNSVGPDRRVVTNLYTFAKWGDYNLTVTESLFQSWHLVDLNCVETETITSPAQTQHATTWDLNSRKATIRLEEGEKVTCTFKNKASNPTAAEGSISGRVTNSDGSGIESARVTAVNAMSGDSNMIFTNSSGFYSFNDLKVGQFYIVTVNRKGRSFSDNTKSFTLMEDIVGLDFRANP